MISYIIKSNFHTNKIIVHILVCALLQIREFKLYHGSVTGPLWSMAKKFNNSL